MENVQIRTLVELIMLNEEEWTALVSGFETSERMLREFEEGNLLWSGFDLSLISSTDLKPLKFQTEITTQILINLLKTSGKQSDDWTSFISNQICYLLIIEEFKTKPDEGMKELLKLLSGSVLKIVINNFLRM